MGHEYSNLYQSHGQSPSQLQQHEPNLVIEAYLLPPLLLFEILKEANSVALKPLASGAGVLFVCLFFKFTQKKNCEWHFSLGLLRSTHSN